MRPTLQGAVFDLDGVVTLTARLHFAAWKRLFDEVARKHASRNPIAPVFDEQAYRRWVDGKPRIAGLRAWLDAAGYSLPEGAADDPPESETIMGLAARKNAYFHEAIEELGADVDEETVELIRDLKSRGIKIGLATSSKNAELILRRTNLVSLFDARLDGIESARLELRGKPHPDIFLECAKRLGVSPAHAVLFEDAAAGVRAGKVGCFGLVIGVDRGGSWLSLREQGADWIVRRVREVTYHKIVRWLDHREFVRPNLLARWNEIEREIEGRRLAVFLDYDGTLTPIVERPELAILSEPMRRVLRRLAERVPVAIVSGRGLEDIQAMVGLDSIWYAASHGFEIEGPRGKVHYRALPELEPAIHRAAEVLRPRVARIEGALIEDKRFSIAVHYRMVEDERKIRELERAVDDVLIGFPDLMKMHGKMIIELRPAFPWNKGRAIEWLSKTMHVEDAIPIYLGDDVTDEHAFAAIGHRGIAALVTVLPRPTEARWSLQNQEDVGALLDRIASREVRHDR